MADLSTTIAPKSDQLNADDLIGRPSLTIKVTKVSLCKEPEQPIAINFEGDGGKPYKPGKSMRRVLVMVWGSDGNAYVGRSMRLFRDEKVLFGGQAVGGIRISHMSHIDKDVTMALTASKSNRRPFTVHPLPAETTDGKPKFADWLATYRTRLSAATSAEHLTALMSSDDTAAATRNKGSEKQKEALLQVETEIRNGLNPDGAR